MVMGMVMIPSRVEEEARVPSCSGAHLHGGVCAGKSARWWGKRVWQMRRRRWPCLHGALVCWWERAAGFELGPQLGWRRALLGPWVRGRGRERGRRGQGCKRGWPPMLSGRLERRGGQRRQGRRRRRVRVLRVQRGRRGGGAWVAPVVAAQRVHPFGHEARVEVLERSWADAVGEIGGAEGG